VRERGLEPLSDDAGWILNPVRLPVPPLSHVELTLPTINYSDTMCQGLKVSKTQEPGIPVKDSTPFFNLSVTLRFSVLKV
jgi:hypothetical protein